jgi:hypothetical protein
MDGALVGLVNSQPSVEGVAERGLGASAALVVDLGQKPPQCPLRRLLVRRRLAELVIAARQRISAGVDANLVAASAFADAALLARHELGRSPRTSVMDRDQQANVADELQAQKFGPVAGSRRGDSNP